MVHKSVAILVDSLHLTIVVHVVVVQIQQTLTNQCPLRLAIVVDHQDQPPVELLLRISPFDCQIFVAPFVALVADGTADKVLGSCLKAAYCWCKEMADRGGKFAPAVSTP